MSEVRDAEIVDGLHLVMERFAWDIGISDAVRGATEAWKSLGGGAVDFEFRCQDGEGQVVLSFKKPPSKVCNIPVEMLPRGLRIDVDGSVWMAEVKPSLNLRWRGPYQLKPVQTSDNHGDLPTATVGRFDERPDLVRISAWIKAERAAELAHPAG